MKIKPFSQIGLPQEIEHLQNKVHTGVVYIWVGKSIKNVEWMKEEKLNFPQNRVGG